MATERFPKRKYLRQLRVMRHDLASWLASYRDAEAKTSNDWLSGRYADRAGVLDDVVRQLDELVGDLEALPRIRG